MLNKTGQGKNQILVESVKPASIADRCGAIYVGDQILSIDDVSFEHVTLAEANQILKNCVGEFSRVEILPLSQMLLNNNNGSGKYQKQSRFRCFFNRVLVFSFLLLLLLYGSYLKFFLDLLD